MLRETSGGYEGCSFTGNLRLGSETQQVGKSHDRKAFLSKLHGNSAKTGNRF